MLTAASSWLNRARAQRALARCSSTRRWARSCNWRAAAWELERAFPEDYCPDPKRRAAFQAQHKAELDAHERQPVPGPARDHDRGLVVVVTNPVDVLTHVVARSSGAY